MGWEAEMRKVDEAVARSAQQAFLRPVKEKNDALEVAAKKKADELADRRQRLLRTQQRRQSRGSESECSDDEDGEAEEDEDLPADEAELVAELTRLEGELRQHGRCIATDSPVAAIPPIGQQQSAGKKQGPSRVWLAFDWVTQRCKLPHPSEPGRKCGAGPGKGSGTSGHRLHLNQHHAKEWLNIQATGEVRTSVQMIKDALAAEVDQSKPALGDKERDELHRLTSLWISKCGRPQAIVEDAELNTLLARILEVCKARLRHTLPCAETVTEQLKLLGHEGKTLARDFVVRLLKSGVKPSISGDLWSEGGMGLFGIYAHGITETWVMEKALIGLVACESERHTAENIKKWTAEALTDIGFTNGAAACTSRSR